MAPPEPQHPTSNETAPPPWAASPASRGLSVRWWIAIAVALMVVAIVLFLGFVAPGFFLTRELDVSKAEDSITALLSDPSSSYGRTVSDLKCNDGQNPIIRRGQRFTCSLKIDGQAKQVEVTFTGDDGNFEVGVPKSP